MIEEPVTGNTFMLVADHPALDIMNTVAMIHGSAVDLLQSDWDVLNWLKLAGWPADADLARLKPLSLLESARDLRNVIRALIEKRKAGKRIDPDALNVFLAEARSHLKLAAKKDGSLQITRKWKQRTAEELLAPLAESAADLLVHGDFDLIRRCESDECVLWFYDQTKSHHRRWCSMSTCGNRHKVAEYRKRRQAKA